MSDNPPPAAERLLRAALGDEAESATILGDLAEDFAAVVRDRGHARARLWYWREAASLAASSVLLRVARSIRRGGRTSRAKDPMNASLGTIGIVQDTRYALRAISRDRGFFLFATLIVGLGVGASTAVYSVVSPLLVQPLPFHEPERLVLIENEAGAGLSGATSRTSNLRDFRARARSFEGLAGYNAFFDQQSYNLVGSGEPERLVGVGVTDDFLHVLGVIPLVGRSFTAAEGLFDGPRAVILSHGFWVRRFGSDRSVVGTTIDLNDEPASVVGVLPPTFDFTSVFTPTIPVDFLIPWPISDETDRQGNTTTIVARLAPGVSVEAAQAELEGILAGLADEDPDRWGLGARTNGLQERIARPFRTGMLLLAAAAALVMLIVCVNLSNMLLARSPRRRREMAVRRTLGATRGRLVRQLLVESTLLAMSGAVVGVAIAVAATRFVAGTQGLEIPLLSSVTVDATALLFTFVLALVAGLAVGVVPALQVAEGGESEALSGSSRGTSAGRRSRRLRELLVVSEVAMACVLLVFGGLVMRSFQHVMDVDLGFDPEGLVAWQISSSRDFENLDEAVAFYGEIVDNVESVPGVEAAGLVDALPLGRNRTWCAPVVGKVYEERRNDCFFPHVVDHRYVDALGVRLVSGRAFTRDDTRDAPPVILVNETAARTIFPEGDALGQVVRLWYAEVRVVGVVGDVKHRALELGADAEFYFPMAQMGDFSTLDLVVRTSLPPAAIVAPVGEAIHRVDARLPVEDFRTLDGVVEASVSPRRFTLQLLGAFALSALLLAGLGIYGVLSYSVTERIPEIGIRMALGASAGDVRRSVVSQTFVLAVVGVGIGAGVALAGTRFIASLLFGVESNDALTFGTMIGVLLAVALISGLVPAIRASRTDSAWALRSAA